MVVDPAQSPNFRGRGDDFGSPLSSPRFLFSVQQFSIHQAVGDHGGRQGKKQPDGEGQQPHQVDSQNQKEEKKQLPLDARRDPGALLEGLFYPDIPVHD